MKIVADTNIHHVREAFASLGDVILLPGSQITRQTIVDVDALLVRSVTRVDADLLDGSPLKFVASATIGTDHVDKDELARRGIGFAHAPGSNANSVAEYITTALLNLARKQGRPLSDMTLGVVGVGNIGSQVAPRAEALGMRVLLNDPPLKRQTGDPRFLPLADLMDADVITLHVPLTKTGDDSTYHLFDQSVIGAMREGALLINSCRGGVVDESALKDALRSGRLSGAILDVWESEPAIDVETLQLAEIGTPHIAGYSLDGKVNGTDMVYRAACQYFGLTPEFDVHQLLPEPQVAEVRIDARGRPVEDVLAAASQAVYNQLVDDRMLRQITARRAEERGAYFESLRKNYPVRREFHNTWLELHGAPPTVLEKAAALGFKISEGAR